MCVVERRRNGARPGVVGTLGLLRRLGLLFFFFLLRALVLTYDFVCSRHPRPMPQRRAEQRNSALDCSRGVEARWACGRLSFSRMALHRPVHGAGGPPFFSPGSYLEDVHVCILPRSIAYSHWMFYPRLHAHMCAQMTGAEVEEQFFLYAKKACRMYQVWWFENLVCSRLLSAWSWTPMCTRQGVARHVWCS